ncbi:MAG: UDP-N-acetylglucosamine 2-epimerase (non-hydrolyzing), partial [Anaerolineales bacterium]
APLWKALKKGDQFDLQLIHTGQHFDRNMSEVFFDQLGLPKPDAYLDVHTDNAPSQIAQIILALNAEFSKIRPDLVVVFGDVNSTLAASIAANKLGLPLAHVEAGLRSFDRSMPEEHNRIVTDMLADFLFTPSPDADENLLNEGVAKERIFRVGNIMADSLLAFRPEVEKLETPKQFGLKNQGYGLVTLHRPSNVDDGVVLTEILAALGEISAELPLLFPMHPRTRKKIEELGFDSNKGKAQIQFTEPLGYMDFLNLTMNARVVFTDSGGIQEETTLLQVACLTLRENTERPVTISQGTNRLVGSSRQGIVEGFHSVLNEEKSAVKPPELWDGKAGERIAIVLNKNMSE